MAYSRLVTPADGVTTVYAVNFPLGYLSIADVKGYVTGEVSETGEQLYRTLTWLTTGTVDIGLPGAVGSDVVIERTVDKTDLVHNFADGDILTEQSLDESFMQSMMAVHEVLDGRFSALGAHLDMNGFRVQNLGDPVDDGDAVPLSWFRENSGANNLEAAQAAQAAAEAAATQSAGHSASAATAQSGSEIARNEAVAAAAAVALPLPVESGGTGATTASAARDNLGVTEAIAAAGMPIGATLMLYGDDSEAPPGYLLMNGAVVTVTYPELRAFGLARGWQVNAGGDPLLPDMGGYFPRGWRTGQVVDSGRVFHDIELDAFQGHKHRTPAGAGAPGDAWAAIDGAEATTTSTSGAFGSFAATYRTLTGSPNKVDGTNGIPRVASETRPVNVAFTFWIKAYPAQVDTGSIDLAELTNDIHGVSARTGVLETAKGALSMNLAGALDNRFNGLPDGIAEFTLGLEQMQPSTNTNFLLRLGTSSGISSAGYYGSSGNWGAAASYVNNTTGILLLTGLATNIFNCQVRFMRRPGSNWWTYSGIGGFEPSGYMLGCGGRLSLPAELTTVQITKVDGTGVFTNGLATLSWRK